MYKTISFSEEAYRKQRIESLINFNRSALLALKDGKGKNIILIEDPSDLVLYNIDSYHKINENVIILSKYAQDSLDMQFIAKVLSGHEPTPLPGYIPSLTASEVLKISQELEDYC